MARILICKMLNLYKIEIMETNKNLLLLIIVLFTITACTNKRNIVSENNTTIKTECITEKNTPSWATTYMGNLPCASCERIETWLTLNEDLSFRMIKIYHKNNQTKSDTLSGSFSWEQNNVRLNSTNSNAKSMLFSIEENAVRQLTIEGKKINGELASHYVLHKTGNAQIENKRWQIIEIFGEEVKGSPETHYLIFHSKDNRLEAKGNCNIMLRNYSITNQFRITINQGITTMMACPDNFESELIKVLDMADNISFTNETLSLNKARMAPLMRLKLIKE